MDQAGEYSAWVLMMWLACCPPSVLCALHRSSVFSIYVEFPPLSDTMQSLNTDNILFLGLNTYIVRTHAVLGHGMSVNFVLANPHLSLLQHGDIFSAWSFFWTPLVSLEKFELLFRRFYLLQLWRTLEMGLWPYSVRCLQQDLHSSAPDLLFPSFQQTGYRCASLSHIPLPALPGMFCCFPPCSCSSSSAASRLWWDCSALGWKLRAQDEFGELIVVYPNVVWMQKQKIYEASSSFLPVINYCLKIYLPLLHLV